jgi:hypothetical protein
MNVIFVLIGLFTIIALPVSLIMMLFKKRRVRGLQFFFASMIGLAISVWGIVQIPETAENSAKEEGYQSARDKRLAELAGYKSAEEWNENREETVAKLQEEHEQNLAGFPDLRTKVAAEKAGITRYEAYRLLSNEDAIARYCAYTARSFSMEKAKQSELDATADKDTQNEVWDKYEAIQRQLLDKLNTDLGLVEFEYINLSNAGDWNWHCRAAERGWALITQEQAKATSRSDAKEAVQALNGFYLENLNQGTSHFFDNDRFSSVHCTWENFDGMRFAGCKLQSFSYVSEYDVFVVGRLADGRLAVSPINGKTLQHITSSGKSERLNQVAQSRTYLEGLGEPRTYLAEHTGQIDISAVVDLFK